MARSFHFEIALVARLSLLLATMAGVAWLAPRPDYVATTLLAVVAVVIQAAALVRSLRRSEAEVARYLVALAAGEPGAGRPARRRGRLAAALDEATARFQSRLDVVSRENHYQAAVIANVPIPLLAVTGDRVTLLNTAARRLAGDARPVTVADLDALGETFRHDVAAVTPGERRTTKLTADGVTRSYVVGVSEVAIGGEVTRLVTLQDIQGELDVAAFRAWDRMVQVLAHEIMGSITPISSLTSSAAVLVAIAVEQLDAGTRAGETLVEAQGALATATRRCDTLLDFIARYRQFSALPRPQRASVALEWLFAGLVKLFASELESRRVILETAVEPRTLEVVADRALLEQALINLVRNAIDAVAGRDGALVAVRARLTRDGGVIIEVADNGPGVAPATLDQLFTPFFTTKRGGSGIGLSLVQQVALAHGGAGWCTSPPSGGAVFAISL